MSDRPFARAQRPQDVALAVVLMLAACALVAATTLFAKLLGPAGGSGNPLHPLQVSAGRFGFAALTLMPFVAWLRPSFAGAKWGNHLLRVLFGWAGVSCLFAAAALMRLADATAISFLNPIVARCWPCRCSANASAPGAGRRRRSPSPAPWSSPNRAPMRSVPWR